MNVSHILIIGAARSGTTLLATMIARHTEIGVLNEDKGWAMRSLLGRRVLGNKRCVPNQIEIKRRGFFQFRFLKAWGIANEYPSSKYSIEDYLRLPNIKIIALIRSGDDVVSSIMKRSKKNFRVASYRWCRAVEVIHELNGRVPDLLLVVSFEDLVKHPKENMERVAVFLELDYQERMLQGPEYNPWYPEAGMNTAKVYRAQRQAADFHLAERFPATYCKYEELLALSQRPH
ncbi:MAG TPA: sulfotransferase [Terriglobales bacterium]|nr:sulfotransferase [Terriglobales bacterium]